MLAQSVFRMKTPRRGSNHPRHDPLLKGADVANSTSYYERNKDIILQKQKIYRLEHPEISRRSARKRRARLNNVVRVEYTDEQVLEMYGTNCHLCSEPIDLSAPRSTSHYRWKKSLHIDHIIPISKGGSDTLENVRPAHGFCNVSKGNRA
jgi:5-methylcytosine-specific restriction endonuclease McrA